MRARNRRQSFNVEGIFRRKIIKKEEGTLTEVLGQDNYRKIVPIANSLEEAIDYLIQGTLILC